MLQMDLTHLWCTFAPALFRVARAWDIAHDKLIAGTPFAAACRRSLAGANGIMKAVFAGKAQPGAVGAARRLLASGLAIVTVNSPGTHHALQEAGIAHQDVRGDDMVPPFVSSNIRLSFGDCQQFEKSFFEIELVGRLRIHTRCNTCFPFATQAGVACMAAILCS